ncbi:FHA domain-containing protein [Gammaproteobacteria bacterium AB-CW1]|uniref:FHA domain-containing protein n=1 Tax=Natronospira elongata TaxID=3110268 RepID=A0AAP6MKX5_9GAMM|nr:FHA domain-containing protein [Gammaproteobacteria bacterium AB-CW1]
MNQALGARLSVYGRDGATVRHRISGKADVSLGRNPACDIVIDDPRVSRRHLRIHVRDGGWWLEDLGSKNGTRLDGRLVLEAALPDAGWLSLGGVPIAWSRDDESGDIPPARRRRTAMMLERPLRDLSDARQLLSDSLRGMMELVEARACSLWLRQAGGELVVMSDLEETTAPDDEAKRLCRQAASIGEAVYQLPSDQDVGKGHVAIPLVVAERLIGLVVLAGERVPGARNRLDRELLEGLAAQAGLAASGLLLRDEILALGTPPPAHATEIGNDSPLQRLLKQVFPAYRQS